MTAGLDPGRAGFGRAAGMSGSYANSARAISTRLRCPSIQLAATRLVLVLQQGLAGQFFLSI